jgi:hypothetical protein
MAHSPTRGFSLRRADVPEPRAAQQFERHSVERPFAAPGGPVRRPRAPGGRCCAGVGSGRCGERNGRFTAFTVCGVIADRRCRRPAHSISL